MPYTFCNFPLMTKKTQTIDIPEDIKYVKDYLSCHEFGKLSYFTKYQRFGPSSKECARLVLDTSPSICFISCFAYSYAQETIDLAGDIKKIKPDLPVVVGGAGVSAYPLYFIGDTNVDFAIVGEAEISLKLFLRAMFEKTIGFDEVPNLCWNKTHPAPTQYTSPDEIIPIIAKVHERKNSTYFSVSLTRGCNKQCRFCSNFLAHGHGFRMATPKSVASMVNRLSIDQKSRILINFEDDNLLCAPENLLKIMQLFREKSGNVAFLAENGIDYALLTRSLADALIDAGMIKFNFTLGSIAENVLESQNRKGSRTHFESIVRHIASRGVPVLSYFICGLKGDTRETVVNVLAYLHSLPTQIGISMFYAVPGLPDFSDLALFNTFCQCRSNGSSAYPWYGNDGLSTSTIVTSFRLSRYVNLLKNSVKSEIELQLIGKIQNEKKLYTLAKNAGKVEIIPAPGMDEELVRMFFLKIEGQEPLASSPAFSL
jgi:anaerobic magnesium-protoporphyrin IX monomethyl ester cyclase